MSKDKLQEEEKPSKESNTIELRSYLSGSLAGWYFSSPKFFARNK